MECDVGIKNYTTMVCYNQIDELCIIIYSLIYRIHDDIMIIKMGIQIEFLVMSIVSLL